MEASRVSRSWTEWVGLSSATHRHRHGHVYVSDTSCEHDQTDGWVVALLCVAALASGARKSQKVEQISYLRVYRSFIPDPEPLIRRMKK